MILLSNSNEMANLNKHLNCNTKIAFILKNIKLFINIEVSGYTNYVMPDFTIYMQTGIRKYDYAHLQSSGLPFIKKILPFTY